MKKGIFVAVLIMIFLVGCVQREVIYKACEIAECERGKVENLITGGAVGVPDSKPEIDDIELEYAEEDESTAADEEEFEEEEQEKAVVDSKDDFWTLLPQQGENINSVELEKACPQGYDGIRVKYYTSDLARYVNITVNNGSGYVSLSLRPNKKEGFEDIMVCHKGRRRCSWLLDEGYAMIEGNQRYKMRVEFVFESIPDRFGRIERTTEYSKEYYLDLRQDSADYFLKGFC